MAKSVAERDEWYTRINRSIETSKGFKVRLTAPSVKSFWQFPQISEEDFISTADDFDILLFQTDATNAKIQRIGTWSEYGKFNLNR